MSLVHGQDPGGYLRPLLLDASGNVLIAGTVNANLNAGANLIGKVDINSSPTLDVHLMTGANLAGKIDINTIPTVTVQGTNSDKLLSINNSKYERKGSGALAAGANTFDFTIVPAGLAYYYTNISFVYGTHVAGVTLNIQVVSGGITYNIYNVYAVTSDQWVNRVLNIVLYPGENLRYFVTGATGGDYSYCDAVGYILHTT